MYVSVQQLYNHYNNKRDPAILQSAPPPKIIMIKNHTSQTHQAMLTKLAIKLSTKQPNLQLL
jgi:hypothetical protein